VNFAKWCGYELMAPEIDSTLKIRLINEKNQILKYKLLNVLEFTSERQILIKKYVKIL